MRFYLYLLILGLTTSAFGQKPFESLRKGENYALVIIDMQPFFVTRRGVHNEESNAKKVNDIIDEQVRMIELAKKTKTPIIFVEYDGIGKTNERLTAAAGNYSQTHYFTKATDGMFGTPAQTKKLESILEKHRIGNLIITGANGGACVHESIQGALAHNLTVVAHAKGIADFNFKDFIYPFSKHYKFTPVCKECVFREAEDHESVALEVAPNPPVLPDVIQVDDSDRGIIKDVEPVKNKDKINAPAAGAVEQ